MKVVILLAFIAILGSLAAAGFFMLKRQPQQQGDSASARRMARALAWRVGLSVALFLLVILAHQMGWLQPNGVPLQ